MNEEEVETRVRGLMGEINQAFVGRDIVALERILSDEFTFSDPGGPVAGKEQWIEDLANGNLSFDSVEAGDVELHRVGDTMRVEGRTKVRARYSRSNYNGSFHFRGIFRNEGGEWRLLLASARPDLSEEALR